jgi:pimeloyl-ACP methyl ester carboxylesterase
MSTIWLILNWLFSIIFGLLTISMLLLRKWLQAFILFLLVLICLPPVSSFVQYRFNWTLHPILRVISIVGLLAVFIWSLLSVKNTSIYKSPQVKEKFLEIYDAKMAEWPVPYKDVFVDTQYGTVHVIDSGPKNAPAVLLLHASGVSSWSWKYNVEDLSQYYRTYAIDLIGDAGKSEFDSLDNVMKDGKDQANLYYEITEKLGVDNAYVVGASEGGFIGTNFALYHPERVKMLALLGPMGYSGAFQSVIRITFTQLFPLKLIQVNTFSWAFSNSVKLKEDLGEWFPLIMTGYNSVKVAPLPFSKETRQSLEVPVLFVFGERDNLVGDPEAARVLVQDIPDVRVATLDCGHLMGAEMPEQSNQLILDFFGRPAQIDNA